MRFLTLLFIFLNISIFSVLSQKSEMYRLMLTDKGNPPFSVDRPYEFLSPKAIERRFTQGLIVDESDLPIDPTYFDALLDIGVTVQSYSKWTKTIVVNVPDSSLLSSLTSLPFVDEMKKVWEGDLSFWSGEEDEDEYLQSLVHMFDNSVVVEEVFFDEADYGTGLTQIKMNNAIPLHQLGYTGRGKTIAVIDGGFENVDKLGDFFNLNRILLAKNFSHNTVHPFRLNESHGTMVLSSILANKPGELIGTAPEASFYLFNTEIGKEEFPIEEDYWVRAVEYADSIGVDIITTSLGYATFDDDSMNHTWNELDGYSIPASRAGSMIAQKGMVLFISAGNLGSRNWQKTSVPGDAKDVLTVGALKKDSTLASFSSWGYIADNRIKPDVMGMGVGVSVVNSSNKIVQANGTSFSTPVLAGLGACLWQSLPHLTSFELMDLVKLSSNKYQTPDEYLGYGIPDIYKAYLLGSSSYLYLAELSNQLQEIFYIDYLNNFLYINPEYKSDIYPHIYIYKTDGRLVLQQSLSTDVLDLTILNKGLYIIMLQTGENQYVRKFIKH